MSSIADEAGALQADALAPAESSSHLERSLVLWLTNVSHAVNHFQNQTVSTLYPVMMAELGFGYLELGTLTAIRTVFGNASQILYGFLTPFARRSHLLGMGNLVQGVGTLWTGMVGGYGGFVTARTVTAIGASAQHPVGASLLAGHFSRNRGTILALNSSLANVGSLAAPLAAGLLLAIMGWRQILYIVAGLSLLTGLVYFLFPERVGAAHHASRRSRLAAGWHSYRRVLRNRNILVISLVQMVGAAGGEGGVNQTYIGPHLVNDLGLSLAIAGLALSVFQLGSVIGPLCFGWLSDRVSRKSVIQAALFLSALGTLSLAKQDVLIGALGLQDSFLAVLLLNLLLYGGITSSRQTLTQALVADSLADEDRDAAFSLYYFIAFFSDPIWSLVTGYLMETSGFSFAFSRLSVSYLAGMALLFLVSDGGRARAAQSG